MIDAQDSSSTRPYLIRALYEWCTDNNLTPFIAVSVDGSVSVPNEFVKDGEIVLNISFDATSSLSLGNEVIEFKGRFGGVARDIYVPVQRVLAIYARENGQGMAFPTVVTSGTSAQNSGTSEPKGGVLTSVAVTTQDDGTPPPKSPVGARPSLKRVK